ncbi:hypothetical protein [Streptomyces sp. CoT10]|uniref:hypothetical protein n=1 Tax=Streptomyces sp. CoT10 TaxID=2875762 RepID=UPI001CD45466|nr:hypothetical protein [Streptomyces sp. CoT10]
MAVIDLDPELKGRILDFIRERECVTVADVRHELFPGDLTRPYFYLDQLTEEGHLWVVPGSSPMAWATVDHARRTRGALRRGQAKRRANSHDHCDHPLTRPELKKCRLARRIAKRPPVTKVEVETPIDPELMEWVRDFVHQRETVSLDDVVREFFPGESHTAHLYLDQLEAEGTISYKARRQVYEWAYSSRRQSVFPATPIRAAHRDCTHPATKRERQKCRARRGG